MVIDKRRYIREGSSYLYLIDLVYTVLSDVYWILRLMGRERARMNAEIVALDNWQKSQCHWSQTWIAWTIYLTGVRSLASLLVFDSDLSVTLKTLACHSLITLFEYQILWTANSHALANILINIIYKTLWVLWDIQNRWHKVFLSYRISTWLKIHAQFDFSLAMNSMEWACNKFSIRFP